MEVQGPAVMLEVVDGQGPTVDEGPCPDMGTVGRPECGHEIEDEGIRVSASFVDEYSAPNLPPIPAESCHLFRA